MKLLKMLIVHFFGGILFIHKFVSDSVQLIFIIPNILQNVKLIDCVALIIFASLIKLILYIFHIIIESYFDLSFSESLIRKERPYIPPEV